MLVGLSQDVGDIEVRLKDAVHFVIHLDPSTVERDKSVGNGKKPTN